MRQAEITRTTTETAITVTMALDGTGTHRMATGVGFFDHMLDQLARHSMIDMTVSAKGDLHIDDHHTVEDCGIALGQALARALGDKRGHPPLRRLSRCRWTTRRCVRRSTFPVGRSSCGTSLSRPPKIGSFDTELVREFFQALSTHGGITLHVDLLHGLNSHHIAEAAFKAVARALARGGRGRSRARRDASLDQGRVVRPDRPCRLRKRQPALRRKGVSAHGARNRRRRGDRQRAARGRRPRRPHRAAGRRRLSGLPPLRSWPVAGCPRPWTRRCAQAAGPSWASASACSCWPRAGHEYGETPGLGWIAGEVVRIAPADPRLKVPHMGWNDLVIDRPHPVLDGARDGRSRLFRAFLPHCGRNPAQRLAHVRLWRPRHRHRRARDNVIGTQFHPEKSQAAGLRLIANFLHWRP